MSKDTKRELDAITEEYQDKSIMLRDTMVSLDARFSVVDEEALKERRKLENYIRLIIQQHQKSIAASIKLLVMGLIRNKVDEASKILQTHIGAVGAGRVVLSEETKRIRDGKELPILVAAKASEVPALHTDVK